MRSRLSPARGWLLRALVLVLVPVVLVTTPHAAQAATRYSEGAPGSFSFGGVIGTDFFDSNCTFTAQYQVSGLPEAATQMIKVSGGDCDTAGPAGLDDGWDRDPATIGITFGGNTVAGSDCSIAVSRMTVGADETFAGSGLLSVVPQHPDTFCMVSSFCWDVTQNRFINDVEASGCEPISMPPIPELPSGPQGSDCKYGTPTSIRMWQPERAGGSPNAIHNGQYTLRAKFTPDSDPVANWAATLYTVNPRVGGTRATPIWGGGVGGFLDRTGSASWATISAWFNKSSNVADYQGFGGDVLVGASISTQATSHPSNPAGTPAWFRGTANAKRSAGGRIGYTSPTECIFWFGPAVGDTGGLPDIPAGDPVNGAPAADDPTTDTDPGTGGDEEADPVNDPPAADGKCDFSWTDPATYMCGLLGAVLDFFDWIKRWLGRLGSFLAGLFVPSDGYLDAKGEQLSTAWTDTAPGQWADAVSGLVPGSIEGCEGLRLNVTFPGDVTVDERIGAACSGSMASIAGIVKLAFSAMIVVVGGLSCLRALGSGFGWNPQVGQRVDAA